MRRRGPTKSRAFVKNKSPMSRTASSSFGSSHFDTVGSAMQREAIILRRISDWPFDLDQIEYQLLSHYAQRFSRIYPAFAGPTNPFLQVFLPLSMQSRPVLDALLALSSVSSWENGSFTMQHYMLKLRHQALRGCKELIEQIMSKPDAQDLFKQTSSVGHTLQIMACKASGGGGTDVVHLLATCGLLLLYEKLSGESEENGTTHLQFFARLFPMRGLLPLTDEAAKDIGESQWNQAIQFLSSLFLYNDLVRSTSFRTPTLSNFYLEEVTFQSSCEGPELQVAQPRHSKGRFEFPSLIARLSGGDLSVTDLDIASWDGRLDWFPSFALLPPERVEPHERLPTADPGFTSNLYFRNLGEFTAPASWTERVIISELYRIAATIYRRQCILSAQVGEARNEYPITSYQATNMGNLPVWATQLIDVLPSDSPFQNTLLWPIAIVAKELTESHERSAIVEKLVLLEKRFKMKHFNVVKEHLESCWLMRDLGLTYQEDRAVLFG